MDQQQGALNDGGNLVSSVDESIDTSGPTKRKQSDWSPTFGELNFGSASLGDARRTKRLVKVADALVRHPCGSLPEKLCGAGELDGLYHLMSCETVTHETVLKSHVTRINQLIAEHDGDLLAIHDSTELDYSTHDSLSDRGQLGNGSQSGWLCQNSLIFAPVAKEVVGLANQVLHCRPKSNKKSERTAEKRARSDRESRLWLEGVKPLPANSKIVDVCDRGADTFEFIEHEVQSGRRFVIRSAHSRKIQVSHASDAPTEMLHEFARSLRSLGTVQVHVPAAKIEKTRRKTVKGKLHSRMVKHFRPARETTLHISAAPIRICAPRVRRGLHGKEPLQVWVVRVWEADPPEGVEPLEWILLTNIPCETFDAANLVRTYYEFRWVIEEYHKAMKTGCNIESPQFTSSERLHPMIALISIVALSLLRLRDQSRRSDAKTRLATEVFAPKYVEVLARWKRRRNWQACTVHDFCYALARLGGHLNRKHDHPPGWITLWKGWRKLQLMVMGFDLDFWGDDELECA